MKSFMHELCNVFAIVQAKVRQAEKLVVSETVTPEQLNVVRAKLKSSVEHLDRMEQLILLEKERINQGSP